MLFKSKTKDEEYPIGGVSVAACLTIKSIYKNPFSHSMTYPIIQKLTNFFNLAGYSYFLICTSS
jgi:hypothetical protein